MNKTICISTATLEESNELERLLERAGVAYVLYEKLDLKKGKLISFFSELISFMFFLKRHKVHKVIGSPCARNRYACVILRIRFGSYMRSVHPNSSAITSISDRIYHFLKKIGLGFSIFNPYQADRIFISTELNRKFLLERDISKDRIFNVGAVWLEKIVLQRDATTRLIYLTQSFSAHHNFHAALEQRKIVEKLMTFCSQKSLGFVLRQHPRDDTDYGGLKCFYGEIDHSPPLYFLEHLRLTDKIISSFSTMALEAMSLGCNVIPIRLESTPGFNALYESFNMEVNGIDALIVNDFNINNSGNIKVFSSSDITYIKEFCLND